MRSFPMVHRIMFCNSNLKTQSVINYIFPFPFFCDCNLEVFFDVRAVFLEGKCHRGSSANGEEGLRKYCTVCHRLGQITMMPLPYSSRKEPKCSTICCRS